MPTISIVNRNWHKEKSSYMYITSPRATSRCLLKDDNEDKGKDIFHGTQ